MSTRQGSAIGHASFDTSLGRFEIAWSGRGVTRINLPLGSGAPVVAQEQADAVGSAHASAWVEPPPWVLDVMRQITLHVSGNPQDFRNIAIDMEGLPPFFRRVYEAARSITPGQTLSYAEVAALAGSPKASRAVGQALAKNPLCPVVPCHRVLAAGGKPGGFSGPGGLVTKMRLLELEGRSPAQGALAW